MSYIIVYLLLLTENKSKSMIGTLYVLYHILPVVIIRKQQAKYEMWALGGNVGRMRAPFLATRGVVR